MKLFIIISARLSSVWLVCGYGDLSADDSELIHNQHIFDGTRTFDDDTNSRMRRYVTSRRVPARPPTKYKQKNS